MTATARPDPTIGDQPELTDGHDALGKAFKGATAAMRRLRARETHRPGELSYAQYSLLFALREQREMPTSELAHAADLSPASATEMLDALVEAGLVHRLRSDLDRRVVLTSLTDRGAALLEKRRSLFEPRWRAALAEFDETELMSAAAVLDRLRQMFDEFADDGDVSRS